MMMMTQRTNIFLLFFCLSTMTIHAMNNMGNSVVSAPPKNNDKKTIKVPYHPASKNKRELERKKTMELKKEREKKLSRILMTDPK